MNLIEQLGGYEAAKEKRDDINHTLENCEFLGGGDAREGLYERLESIEQALLEYRRQHNIFEVGDKVVLVGGGTTDVLLEIVYHKYTDDLYRACVLSTGSFGPIHKDNIRHATDEEIKAGKRLEVNQ